MSSHSSEHLSKYFDPERGVMKDVLIRAGAGAGKTTELVRRVISLALTQFRKNGEWPRLVVTTFTRKATQELRERLLLAGLRIGDEKLLQYLQSSQSLHISTIHGILSVYLKRYGRALDLPPDFQLIDPLQMTRMARRTLRGLLKEEPDFARDFQELCEETELRTLEEAVLQWGSLQLESESLSRVREEDLRASHAAFVAQVEADAHEIVAGLRSLELSEGWQKWLKAFEDFAGGGGTAVDRALRFADRAAGLRTGKAKGVTTEFSRQAGEVRDKILSLTEYAHQSEFWQRHEELSVRFERLARSWGDKIRSEKIRRAQLTMEDLELFALWLMQKSPESAASFSNEWDYWLIDEYQDTSPRQVKLIEGLTQGRKVFVVGDPQQSIYLFRGARAEVFAAAEDKIRARGGECLELMTNYRTSGPVLEFMNQLFTSVSPQLSPMQAGRAEEPIPFPHVTLWQLPKEITREKKVENPQTETCLHRIQELIQAGVTPESICVLARKRSQLAAIARLAAELGIPCQLHATGQFFERREIRDALAFLKFLVTPEDNENLVALLRSPWLPLTDQQILEICHPHERSFWSVLKQKGSESEYLSTYELLSESLARIQREGVARVWRELLVQQGLFDFALKLDPSGRREANLWKLVQSLFMQESQPGFRYTDFLQQPEQAGTEDGGAGDASPVIEPKRVQLMTVHASKGLQFPHVIVPYLDDDVIRVERGFFCWNEHVGSWGLCLREPDSQKLSASLISEGSYEIHKTRSRQEWDRLFYVALTRAQSSLSLVWAAPGDSAKDKAWVAGLNRLAQRTEAPWRLQFREERPEPAVQQGAEAALVSVRAPWEPVREPEAVRQVVSVTAVLGEVTAASGGSASAGQTWEKIRKSVRGTEVHRLMESLKYDPARRLAHEGFREALDFLDGAEGSFLKPLIAKGEVEWGFAVRHGDRLLQGQIDLWGRDESGTAWVIDYKTGSPDHSDKALLQLELYAWALRKLGKVTPDEPVLLAAVFPFHGRIVQKKAPSQHEIEKVLAEKLSVL